MPEPVAKQNGGFSAFLKKHWFTVMGVVFVFCAIGCVAWLLRDFFSAEATKVSRNFTNFKSESGYLTEAWFRDFVGLNSRGKTPPSLERVLERLNSVEQIRSVDCKSEVQSNRLDFRVFERIPRLRVVVKDKNDISEMRFMDADGTVFRAVCYSEDFVKSLPLLRDETLVCPDEKNDDEPAANAAATASPAPSLALAVPAEGAAAPKPASNSGSGAVRKSPELPRVLGGKELAHFSGYATEVLPSESLTWSHISAKDFYQGIPTLPNASICVVLSPEHQPVRVENVAQIRRVIFSADPLRFSKELDVYARPEFRDWLKKSLLAAATQNTVEAFDLSMGEERPTGGRVARLRPILRRKNAPSAPEFNPVADSAVAPLSLQPWAQDSRRAAP